MASHHNPDAVMADEQLAVGDDTITDLGDYVLEDLPDGALPELNGEPAAKKQCGEGTSSGSAGPSTSTAAPPASQPMRRSNSSGSSATTAPSSPRPAVPPRPSRPIEVKIHTDPYPDFSAAKARGDTHVVVRNVPLGIKAENLHESLLTGKTEDGLPWLADLLHFHRLKDSYDGSAYSQMLGLPIAAEGDLSFERKLLGQNAATAAFKKHPGLVLIGLDLDVEVWACSVCDYECGIALESAMFHINSDSHRTKLQDSAHLNATKDKYGAWKAETMVQHHRIKALLQ
ncbi:unnamed protein product [Closterium sp. NIES-65]|nr:unnamed protein product [Closterium sp. NIES-65]